MGTKRQKPKYGGRERFCRKDAAEYLGVSTYSLIRFAIPFAQYTKGGVAIYKKSVLDGFEKEHTKIHQQAA